MKGTSRLPLNSLRAFAVAARMGSFTAAGVHLNVAPSAVSRQVAKLEEILGTDLFVRRGNRLRLTAPGQTLADSVDRGLGTVQAAFDGIGGRSRDALVIACSIDVAQLWVMPRLATILDRVPRHHVRLVTPQHTDIDDAVADLSIRFGEPSGWRCRRVALLQPGRWFPVCAPSLIARYPALLDDDPAGFRAAPLLHLSSTQGAIGTWSDWFADAPLPNVGPVFTNYTLLMQAAAAGLGVALAWRGFVEAQLATGALVRLSPREGGCTQGFHLLEHEAGAVATAVFDALAAEPAAAGRFE